MNSKETIVDDLAKQVKASTISSYSPEEILDSLDRTGIESYVTENGDLMIKYWQTIAEDFVSPERAAVIRASRKPQEKIDQLEWLSNNLEKIEKEYSGKWIAVQNEKVIESSNNLPELLEKIRHIDNPFITFISNKIEIWSMTYVSE